jgi:uncharacterized membrane protein YhhN
MPCLLGLPPLLLLDGRFVVRAHADPVLLGVVALGGLYGAWLLSLLLPSTEPPLTYAVPVYALIILAMGISAAVRARLAPVGRATRLTALFGALLFIASDSILGIDKFHARIPHGHVWVMATYYSGQALLTFSAAVEGGPKSKSS